MLPGLVLAALSLPARAASEPASGDTAIPAQDPRAAFVTRCQQIDAGPSACTEAIESGLWKPEALAWAYTNRGLAHAAAGDLLGAIKDHSQAIQLAPDSPAAWSNRGTAHAALGDLLPALEDHQKALDLDPTNASAWHNRGVDFEELGRYRDALSDYRKAIELDPMHLGSHFGLATANCKLSRIKRSVEARLALVTKGLMPPETLQTTLKNEGFYTGPIDGLFGKGSRAALRAWTRKGCLPNA